VAHYLDKWYLKSPVIIQNIMMTGYGFKIYHQRFGKHYEEWMQFFDESEKWSLTEQETYQNKKLLELIRYCYDYVPYYRNVMKARKLIPSDIKTISDLPKLPILTKDDIRNHFYELISTKYRPEQLKQSPTSGTTGSPLTVLWDRNLDIINNAALWRHRSWAGINFRDPYASLLGRVIISQGQKYPPFWRRNYVWNQLYLSTFHLKDDTIPYYFDALKNAKVEYIEAYPSTIYILAQYLDQHNENFPLKCISTSSETLLPIQREIIERRFQCKIHDAYSQSEGVMFSGECSCHSGHHLFSEYGITEIVDENNRLLPPNNPGKIIGTSLHNYGMPLLRYENGDVTSINKDKTCKCGRELPLIANITTKAEDIVVLPDGRLISASILTHPFKPMKNIIKSQIVQKELDTLEIKIVKRSTYSKRDETILLTEFKKRLGSDINILIKYVEDIPLSANGKYRWVISNLPLNFGNKQARNLFAEN
jgi:phenylacetate-CoA ligase